MKKLLVMASLVVVSTSMVAIDLEYYLGAGAERINVNALESNTGGYSNKYDIEDTALLLKAGILLNKIHRVSISHAKYSYQNTDLTTILGSYDYLISINEQFKLYAGVHAGNAEADINAKDRNIEKISFSGLAYGAQIGTIYDITKNVELELGLAYTKFNVDREEDLTWNKFKLDDTTSMFMGINYKF